MKIGAWSLLASAVNATHESVGSYIPKLTVGFVVSAAGLGFEPRYTAPEAVVLPLDDPAMREQ